MSALSALWKPVPLVARQLRRNARRTVLTFLGLVISFFLFTALESVLYTMTSVISSTASDSLLFLRPRDRLAFWRPSLPRTYTEQVASMPGVAAAAPIRFHFGRGRDEASFAGALGVDLDAQLAVRSFRGVTSAEVEAMRASKTAGIVGRRMLDANGWKIGGEVTIRSASGRVPPFTFTAVGDISEDDRFGGIALVHLDYLEDVLGGGGRVTFVQARVRDASIAGATAQAIDDYFANFTIPTETITEKAHIATVLGSLSDALGALRAIGYLTLFVTVLIVGNSVAMSVRERTVEIGTLRAIGFGRARVLGLVLGEAMLVAVAGGVVGAAIAYGIFSAGWVRLPIEAGFEFVTDWTVVVRSAALALPVGALAAFQPAWSAVRMPIVDALRYAD